MVFILGSDCFGERLKETLKQYLLQLDMEVIDATEHGNFDFVDATKAVVREVYRDDSRYGIVVDAYGAGPFMTACRIKGVVAAEVSDERTAYMTRSHNNARIITIGSLICGEELAKNIVRSFAQGSYDGGRHQVRVDMLEKMGRKLPVEELL